MYLTYASELQEVADRLTWRGVPQLRFQLSKSVRTSEDVHAPSLSKHCSDRLFHAYSAVE